MKSSKIKHIISISSLTFYLILAGGSTEDTTSSLVKNETPKLMDEDYPLNIKVNEYIEDENKVIDIPTKNVDLNIPHIPACLKLHDVDVIVRIRTLKEKNNN